MENLKLIGNYLRLNSSNLITRIKLFILVRVVALHVTWKAVFAKFDRSLILNDASCAKEYMKYRKQKRDAIAYTKIS